MCVGLLRGGETSYVCAASDDEEEVNDSIKKCANNLGQTLNSSGHHSRLGNLVQPQGPVPVFQWAWASTLLLAFQGLVMHINTG